MQFYCGIDLGARKTHLCLIKEQNHRLLDRKMDNNLNEIESMLSPYKPYLEIVVESTINWEWLVYGLQKKDYEVSLAHTRAFCSYCRVVPGIHQSSDKSYRSPNSKQGNHYLKWAFSQATIMAIKYYPEIRRLYDRLSAKRKKAARLVARSIISHKLAQAAYNVMKYQCPYSEELFFRFPEIKEKVVTPPYNWLGL